MNHLKTGNAYFGGGSYKNFKMQGQELQETGFYAYKWRNYMPDVGRFFNVDPLSEKYVYQSHYNFSENRVIDARELEGLEAKKVNEVSLPDDPWEFGEMIAGGINSVRASVSNNYVRVYNLVSGDKVRNKYEVDTDGSLTLVTGVPKESLKEKAVNGAFDLGTIALAAAGGPEGMLMSQGGKAPTLKAIEEIKAEAKLISKEAVAKNGTLQPGPFAGEGVVAKNGKSRNFTAEERKIINEQGGTLGCHTCGQKKAGTKSGNFILDHQPPNAIAPDGSLQILYPHCKYCSASQGGIISGMKRNGQIP